MSYWHTDDIFVRVQYDSPATGLSLSDFNVGMAVGFVAYDGPVDIIIKHGYHST